MILCSGLVYSVCDASLLITVEGDDSYRFIILSGFEDVFKYLDDFLCFLGVCSVYPFTLDLISFDRSAASVLGYIGRNLEISDVEGIV